MPISAEGQLVLERLRAMKLLQGRGQADGVVRLGHKGRLKGGLSIAFGVTGDEVFGALVHALELGALVKLVDVRGRGPVELHVAFSGKLEKWEVEHLEGLVHNLNDLARELKAPKRLAVLGEHEDMVQLWALSEEHLAVLLEERWFTPRNARALRPREPDEETW